MSNSVSREGLKFIRAVARLLPWRYRTALRIGCYKLASWLFPDSGLAHQYRDFLRATGGATTQYAGDQRGVEPASARSSEELVQAAREHNSDAQDLFFFPIIDWHFRIQRPQHLAVELARRGHRVFYFTTMFSPGRDSRFEILESPAAGVFLCQLACSDPQPTIYADRMTPSQQQQLAGGVARLREAVGSKLAINVIHHPFWFQVARAWRGIPLVYDCMDYHAAFSNVSDEIANLESGLFEEADLVVTSSLALSEHVGKSVPNVIIRNAADVEFFASQPERLAWHDDRPTVGYFGAIAEWFDVDLVARVAGVYANWDFVLIGSCAYADTRALRACPNVRLIGELAYEVLPSYLHAFDVCVIPFRMNDLTRHTNPVKVYEYLSAGKPVVATALPELAALDDGLVHIALDPEEFVSRLAVAMAERNDAGLSKWRQDWARKNSWEHRVAQFDAELRRVALETEQEPARHGRF